MNDNGWWALALIILLVLMVGFKLLAFLFIGWLVFQCLNQMTK